MNSHEAGKKMAEAVIDTGSAKETNENLNMICNEILPDIDITGKEREEAIDVCKLEVLDHIESKIKSGEYSARKWNIVE